VYDVIVVGLGGMGNAAYKFASMVDEILADGATRHSIDLLSPDRAFTPTPEG
jgi:hypothetical protein